jgi:molybdopterin-guanine dinucleotide biosynthesis protein A
MSLLAVVLAGGRSSRFGSEKAMAQLQGRPLVAHVAAAIGATAVNAPSGSGAAAWARAAGLAALPDPAEAPRGPLAGVLAALDWAAGRGAEAVLTAPCDTPFLPSDLGARLRAALTADAGAAYATAADGLHPLCAIWRSDRRVAVARMAAGERHPPMRDVLAALGAIAVAFEDPVAFRNLNRAEDLS